MTENVSFFFLGQGERIVLVFFIAAKQGQLNSKAELHLFGVILVQLSHTSVVLGETVDFLEQQPDKAFLN